MARSTFANWFGTTLTAGINSTDVNADVVTTGTLSAPCYIVIRPRDPANREVWYATTVTSTRFTVSSTSDRYLAGSAKTSGQTHPTDAEVWCVPLGQHLDDLWNDLDQVIADLASHEAETSPHSATAAATASRLVVRDANARAKVADPSADGDIVNLSHMRDTMPRGFIDDATRGATASTTSTSYVDLGSNPPTVTYTFDAGRKVRVTATWPSATHTGPGRWSMLIADGANNGLQSQVVRHGNVNAEGGGTLVMTDTPAAGSKTYKLRFRAVDAGTVTVNPDIVLTVEDIGPA